MNFKYKVKIMKKSEEKQQKKCCIFNVLVKKTKKL